MKADVKLDGTKYYSYILIYVNDISIVSHNPNIYMTQLQDEYYVKKESIGPPNSYLGAEITQARNRTKKWHGLQVVTDMFRRLL